MSDNEMVAMIVTVLCMTGSFVFVVNAWFKHRRGGGAAPRIDPAAEQRLARIENAVEAIAVEVERIAEGQRFTTKLLSDRANAEAAHVR